MIQSENKIVEIEKKLIRLLITALSYLADNGENNTNKIANIFTTFFVKITTATGQFTEDVFSEQCVIKIVAQNM